MLQGFCEAIEKYNMLEEKDVVCAALSGGADSVCLLLNLLEYQKLVPFTLTAMHVHHGIRGKEADRDASFCEELCKRLHIPFILERLDVPSYAGEKGLSMETAARELRYEALERRSGGKIATAHTLSDQGETILLNLTRGTGLKGLCGIPPVRGRIIRPLLFTSRKEVEEYLSDRNEKFVFDGTNSSREYSRNKIRLDVIPVLKEINPSLEQTIKRMVSVLSEEEDFLEGEALSLYKKAESGGGLSAEILKSSHAAVSSRCIKKLLENHKLAVSAETVFKAKKLLESDGKINISGNVYLQSKRGILSIVEETPRAPDFSFDVAAGKYEIPGGEATISVISREEYNEIENVHKKFAIYGADYDKIQGNVILRNRRSGDRLQLQGRSFHSSLKKLFSEKVPINERSGRCLLEDGTGVIFAEGFGFSERVKIMPETERIFCIVIKRQG